MYASLSVWGRKPIFILAALLMPFCALAINLYSLEFESESTQLLFIEDMAHSRLDLQNDFTVEAWVRPETIEFNQPMDIVSKFDASDPGYTFSISGTPGALQVLFVDPVGNASQFETDPVITTPGEWHHVAVVTDISIPTARFYVDGEEVPVALVAYNAATTINNSEAPFRIGTRGGDTFYFDGLIDEVRVWNTKRSKHQIRKSMGGKVIGNKQHLVGEWSFDEQNYNDSSGNGNHLTPDPAALPPVFTSDIP